MSRCRHAHAYWLPWTGAKPSNCNHTHLQAHLWTEEPCKKPQLASFSWHITHRLSSLTGGPAQAQQLSRSREQIVLLAAAAGLIFTATLPQFVHCSM